MDPPKDTETSNQPEKVSLLHLSVHSFIVVPFLIAIVCVAVISVFKFISSDRQTVYGNLNEIKMGNSRKSWQSAYELSKMISDSEFSSQVHEPAFVSEMISTFENFG